jgi:adenosylhomocysteinase
MNYIQKRKAEHREHFFSDDYLNKNIKISKHISVVAVVHIIDTGIPYIKTLDKYFSLEYIIPKPKSINKKLLKYFPKKKILNLTRDGINNTDDFLSKLNKIPKNNKIILLDIGGYFSQIGNRIKKRFGNKFIGIIEDTENGHKRYLNQKLEYPVISVARSLLKKMRIILLDKLLFFQQRHS